MLTEQSAACYLCLDCVSTPCPPSSCSALSSYPATPPPELYTLSLHDALPIYAGRPSRRSTISASTRGGSTRGRPGARRRSEEHTSELQSHSELVCRLLLEKKKNNLLICNSYTSRQSRNGTTQTSLTHVGTVDS